MGGSKEHGRGTELRIEKGSVLAQIGAETCGKSDGTHAIRFNFAYPTHLTGLGIGRGGA